MSPCMEEIVFDLIRSVPVSVIARKFHNTMERMIVEECVKASHETGIKQVVLAGGVFQNKLLLAGVMLALKRENLHAFTAYQFPVNDGGIALGQLMVAAELE